MSDSTVLSSRITDTDITVQVFNPGYGFRIDRSNPSTLKAISDMAPNGVGVVHMPIPIEAGGEIADLHMLGTLFVPLQQLGNRHVTYARDRYDGVVLGQGQAYAVTSADCPTVVVHGRDSRGKGELHAVVAHAGRDSLLNKELLEQGVAIPAIAQANMVMHNAVKHLAQQGVDVEVMCLYVYCGMRTGFCHPPDHPAYGEYNRAMLNTSIRYRAKFGIVRDRDTGEVDLYRLIKAQAVHLGLSPHNIVFDDIDTGNPSQGWASRRRQGSWERGERNLVIVSRPTG